MLNKFFQLFCPSFDLLRTLFFSGSFVALACIPLILAGLFLNKHLPNKFWQWFLLGFFTLSLLPLLTDTHYLFTKNVPKALHNLSDFLSISSLSRFFAQLMTTLYAGLVLIFIMPQKKWDNGLEKTLLILLSYLGGWTVIFSHHMLSLYIGIEMQSLCFYALIAMGARKEAGAAEAAIKYFVLSSLSSCFLVFGIALYYGFSHSLQIKSFYDGEALYGILLSSAFILTAAGFKLSTAPFHMWTPDVYEGAPTFASGLLSLVSKLVAIALLMKFLMIIFLPAAPYWQPALRAAALLSIAWGSLGAIMQTNLKRLIGYSSISQMGFVLLALSAATVSSAQVAMLYITLYGLTLLGLWACVYAVMSRNEHTYSLKDISSLAHKNPLFGSVMAIFLFSMAGIPPLSGFFAKFFVFEVLISAHAYKTAIAAAVLATLSAVYYLRVIKVIYFDEPRSQAVSVELGRPSIAVISLAALVTLLFFLYPGPILKYIYEASQSLN